MLKIFVLFGVLLWSVPALAQSGDCDTSEAPSLRDTRNVRSANRVDIAMPRGFAPRNAPWIEVLIVSRAEPPVNARCANQWQRVTAELQIPAGAVSQQVIRFDSQSRRARIDGGDQAFSVVIYDEFPNAPDPLQLQLNARSDGVQFAFRDRTFGVALSEQAFNVVGDRNGQRQVYPVLLPAVGNQVRLILLACAQTCTRGMIAEVMRLEEAKLAGEIGAGQPPPPPSSPPPSDRIAANTPPPAPAGQQPPPPPAPALRPGADQKGAKGAPPPAPATRPVVATKSVTPTGTFRLAGYDIAKGVEVPFSSGAARAVWGDCSTRDDFGPPVALKGGQRDQAIPIYGPRMPADSLCLVIEATPGSSATEKCYRKPSSLIPGSLPADGKSLWVFELPAQLEVANCPSTPAPWAVRFVDKAGGALDPDLLEELIEPSARIAGLPIGRSSGALTVALRSEHLQQLRTQKEEAISVDPQAFIRQSNITIDAGAREVVVPLELKVVSLAGLQFDFKRKEGGAANDCELTLNVPREARVGRRGWDTIGQQPIVVRHVSQSMYELQVGRPLNATMLRRAFVELAGNDTTKRLELAHRQGSDSEKSCYLLDPWIKDAELTTSKLVAREVGQPQPSLFVVVTTDASFVTSGMRDGEYQEALAKTLRDLDRLPTFRSNDVRKPFESPTIVVASGVGQPDARPYPITSGEPLRAQQGPVTTAYKALIAQKTPPLQFSQLRDLLDDQFAKRGIQKGSNPPAYVVYIGGLFSTKGGTSFCSPSLPGLVNNADWLPPTRKIIKVSFATRDAVDAALVTSSRPNGQLVRLEGTQQKVIYGCAHNVVGRVEDYVVVVPEGQEDGDRGAEVRTTLLVLTQKMFAHTPTDQ